MRTIRHARMLARTGCVAALGALTAGSAAQSLLLRPQFKEGRTVYIERVHSTHQTMTGGWAGEQGRTLNIKQLTGELQTVESSDGKGAKLRDTIDRFRRESDAMTMEGTFDSDARSDDESPEFAEIFGPMIGESYRVEVDSQGNVASVSGVDKIVQKMEESAGSSMTLSQLTRNMSDEQFKTAIQEGVYLLYANKEVKAGDTWARSITRSDSPMGTVNVKYDLRVESVSADGATVSYEGSMSHPEGAAPSSPNPMIKSLRIKSGKISGKATFDKDGQLSEDARTSTVDLEFELNMPAAEGQPPPTMTVSSSSTQTLKVMSEAQRNKQKAENKQAAEKEPKAPGEEKPEPEKAPEAEKKPGGG